MENVFLSLHHLLRESKLSNSIDTIMKNLITLFLIMLVIYTSNAQEKCASHHLLEKYLREQPTLRNYVTQYLQRLNQRITNYPFNPQLHQNAITIPVVVHVLYKNAAENISDDVIRAQLAALSNEFRKRNTSVSSVPEIYRNRSADTYIQFRLVSRDTLGNATTGIYRRSTTRPYFLYNTEEIKSAPHGIRPWDVRRYLNVWIGDIRWTQNGVVQDNLLGYGTFPEMPVAVQGIVMDYTQFGAITGANYTSDRTWAHEMGHFFGLRHVWGDANCGDDFVADTPTQQAPNFGCPTFPHVSCSNGPNGDMFMNFMDYVDDNCMHMFTEGQRARILANLAPGGARASLAVSNALYPPNAVSRNFEVFLEPQSAQLPSWKAALAMVHGWACQCTPAIDQMVQMNASQPGRHINGIPNAVSEVIHALALRPREILACYSIEGFYQILQKPVALISISANEYYGLVITGMEMNATTGRAILKIKDPMNIGPRGFSIDQQGSEYNVDYQEFMLETLERLGENGKRVFIVSPPSNSI